MARKSGDLTRVGLILSLISGILAIIDGVLSILDLTVDILSFGTVNLVGRGGLESSIISIVVGIVLVFIYQGRVKINDLLILGIVLIVLGLLGGGLLAVIGGILVLIDYFA